jgi:hypothetical protein
VSSAKQPLRHAAAAHGSRCRWAMSYLRGPMTRDEIKKARAEREKVA